MYDYPAGPFPCQCRACFKRCERKESKRGISFSHLSLNSSGFCESCRWVDPSALSPEVIAIGIQVAKRLGLYTGKD